MRNIVWGDAVADTITAQYLDDGLSDLKWQTSPVLQAAAIFIGSFVGPTSQKLVK